MNMHLYVLCCAVLTQQQQTVPDDGPWEPQREYMKVAFHGERPSSEPVEASSTAATASSGTATAAATSTSATAGTAVTVTSNAATASGAARDDYVEDARLLNPELVRAT
jgi:hypothetical protein